jgi:PAS domain S-box-containing protein
VIVLTGLDDEAVALRALHEGAQDYLMKGGLDGGQLPRAIRYAMEREQAARAIRENEELLRTVVESAPIVLFATDREGTVTLCRGSGLDAAGVAGGELAGRSAFQAFAPYPDLAGAVRRGLAGEPHSMTAQVRDVAYQVQVTPARDTRGVIAGMIGVATDVTERLHAEARLQRTIEDLQAKTSELESFTYSVSHDLKEPLRTMEAFSQFLLEDYAEKLDEQARDYLERMGRAGVRLRQMIEELLVLARVGQRFEEPVRVDVLDVVRNVVSVMQVAVEEKRVRVEIEAALPAISGNVYHAEQIFGNLVGNALKFNQSAEPLVRIGVRSVANGRATFYVQDNGIGVDPEYHDRIFQVFQQLHKRDEYAGTGAGLTIVKRAAEALGGSVQLESVLGEGATFLVRLPVWEAERAAQVQAA